MSDVLALGDETALSALQDILEPFGHVLVAVDSPKKLVAALRSHSFDLVLCDVDRKDLRDLVRQTLEIRQGVRLVAVTSTPQGAEAAKALKDGAHSLMNKPFEIGQVLQLLSAGRP